MGNQDDPVSRRKFLEQAGLVAGVIALGDACSDDEGEPAEQAGTGGDDAGSSAAGSGDAAGGAGRPAAGGGGGTAASPSGPAAGAGGVEASGGVGGESAAGTGGAGGAAGADEAGAGGEPAAGTGGTGGAAGGGAAAGKVVVAIVATSARPSLEEAVARAVELAGGLGAIKPGQTVFIKPNAVSDRMVGTPGIRTSPEVLAAVVRLVKSLNPGRIIVGDRSARQFPDAAGVFERSGLRQAALDAGADEVYAPPSPVEAPDEWVLLQPPSYEGTWGQNGGLLAMKRIIEADHLINVPTVKNHRYALFSLSMKNFMGAIGDSSRDPVHFLSSGSSPFDPIGNDIAVLNQMFSPLMNILDGTTALINGGPQGDGSDAVRASPGLIFASGDRVAVDAAAVSLIQLELATATVPEPDAANAILKRDPAWRLPQIVRAIEHGLGVGSADMVQLAFEGVGNSADIEARFRAV
ncbi:MAG: DUF362 domain-containing protein [Polyangiales bacterium]